jgi:hypothetical protein
MTSSSAAGATGGTDTHDTSSTDDATTWSRRAWASLETLHVAPYFSPENRERYKALGLHPDLAYFAVRSAAMGPVPAEVVEACFFVFAPRLVRKALPGYWATAAPDRVLAARHEGASRTLHRILDPVLASSGDELTEAVDLARRACEGLTAPGRPLYAAHASLPWPDDPLMQLWHAATLLREHRGDGHVAALLTAGLHPIEAMLTAALAGSAVTLTFQRRSRGWTDAEWDETAQRLREQGVVEDAPDGGVEGTGLALTPTGAMLRAEVEAGTDLAALAGWSYLGDEGTRRLAELVRPLSKAVVASGALAATRSNGKHR